MTWLLSLLVLAAVLWAVTRLHLDGEDLSRFDGLAYDRPARGEPSQAHHDAVARIQAMQAESPGGLGGGSEAMKLVRERVDAMGLEAEIDARIDATSAAGVPAEWVRAPGADPDRRLLYLHGGAYVVGSPRSHRPVTAAMSRATGCAVLAIDYRLMPEHRRLDGIDDCRTAYRWIVENGPDGPAPADVLLVAGDSAGGNLTLGTIAWARDTGQRPADAAIALSPHTDSCMASPSLQANLATDHMLGPLFARLAAVPRFVALWVAWFGNRVRPADPRVSPLRGTLTNLPPTLVHASEAEMLLDDARRYVARARAEGSTAELRTWHDMLHVWHIFEPTMPEAQAAFEDIAAFVETHAPASAAASGAATAAG